MRLLSKNGKIIALVFWGDGLDWETTEKHEIHIPLRVKDDNTKEFKVVSNLIFLCVEEEFEDYFCSELTFDSVKNKETIWKTTNGDKLIYNPYDICFEPVQE